jgi:chromosome segregation ATPase
LHLSFARDVLALLSELEQAERERNEIGDHYNAAVARLAKVPALVEAASRLLYDLDRNQSTLERSVEILRDALAVWEQE